MKHPALRVMPSIFTLRMSPLVPSLLLPHTTDAETQIDPVTIFQVRHFANAAVVTDDIIAPMNVDHDYSYVKLPSDSVRIKTLVQMMHTM